MLDKLCTTNQCLAVVLIASAKYPLTIYAIQRFLGYSEVLWNLVPYRF